MTKQSKYLEEFEKLNTTTENIYDLGEYDVLIILKDGTNLTSWDQVNNKSQIIYISEDLSKYTDLREKYVYLISLKAIVLKGINGDVESMSNMFCNCFSLVEIASPYDLNTSGVKDLEGMFENCNSLVDISALSSWNMDNVTNMSSTFSGCSSLVDISALRHWNTSKVKDMSYLFKECSSLMDISALSYWNTKNVTSLHSIFSGCSSLIDISALKNWNTENTTDMITLFNDCKSLVDLSYLSNWDTSQVTNMESMFDSCYSLADIFSLSGWNTHNVTDMGSIFKDCFSLVDISALGKWNTDIVNDMQEMFYGCSSLTDISILKNWNTKNVTNMRSLFYGCDSLVDLSYLSNWDISQVTNMRSMFYHCSSIVNLSGLEKWDTSQVTNMKSMFNHCSSLLNLCALENWDTSQVTNMAYMFSRCDSLEDADALNEWDTSNVTSIRGMFNCCNSLSEETTMNFTEFLKLTQEEEIIELNKNVVLFIDEKQLLENAIDITSKNLTIIGNNHRIDLNYYENSSSMSNTENITLNLDGKITFKDINFIYNAKHISYFNIKNESEIRFEKCNFYNIVIKARDSHLDMINDNFNHENYDFPKHYLSLDNSFLNIEDSNNIGVTSSQSTIKCTNSNVLIMDNYNDSKVILDRCNITKITNTLSEINLTECSFVKTNENSIKNEKGVIEIENTDFSSGTPLSKQKRNFVDEENRGSNVLKFIKNRLGTIRINNSSFQNNNSNSIIDGGAICNESGTITLNKCLFKDNSSNLRGGAIYNGGFMNISSSKFIDNYSKFGGKSIHNDGNIILDSCEFRSDEEEIIFNNEENMILKNLKIDGHHKIITNENIYISDNEKDYNIIYLKAAGYLQEQIENNDIIKLNSYILGGNIEIEKDNLVIDGCGNVIEANNLENIFTIKGNNITLKNITFRNGKDGRHSGAIINYAETLNIENCSFVNNHSNLDVGGAIENIEGQLNILNCVFKDNIAEYDGSGGAIYIHSGETNIENTQFINNLAGKCGGAIYNEGRLNVNRCKFADNTVRYIGQSMLEEKGGAIYNQNGVVNINCSEFKDNDGYRGGKTLYNNGKMQVKNSSLTGEYQDDQYQDIIDNRSILTIENLNIDYSIFNNGTLNILANEKSKYRNIENKGKIIIQEK